MPVNPRLLIATISVLVFTLLFALFVAPLLTLVPTGTAHAQEQTRGKISIDFNPSFKVFQGDELNFTLTFSGLDEYIDQQGLTYDVSVIRTSRTSVTECEGNGTGDGISMGTISSATTTRTGTISGTCRYGAYALVATLYDGEGEEVVTTARAFKVDAYRAWKLSGSDMPTSPSGLWAVRDDDYELRFHVVDSATNKVYVYSLAATYSKSGPGTTTLEETYTLTGASNPWGLSANASTTWVADDGSGSTDNVYAYSNADRGVRVSDDEFTLVSENSSPRGMMSYTVRDNVDGLYVVDSTDDSVFYYEQDRDFGGSTSSFTHLPEWDYHLHEDNADPTGLWLTGWLMFVADDEDDKVYAYDMVATSSPARMPQFDVNGLSTKGNTEAAGIWSDFGWIYVLDSAGRTIHGYEYPDIPFKPVQVSATSSYVRIPENSTTTGVIFEVEDTNDRFEELRENITSLSLYRLNADDRIFKIKGGKELAFSEPANYEAPRDADRNNVYELIITGRSVGFSFGYFPMRVEITDVPGEQPSFASTTAVRNVAEGERTNRFVRPPIEAVNPDNDLLHFSFTGPGADEFDIATTSTTTVHFVTRAPLDSSSTSSYTFTLEVRDSEDTNGEPSTTIDDRIEVTINVLEGPEVSGATSTSYAENGIDDVATFNATNPGGGTLAWHLEGDDAGDFTISGTNTGATLRFAATPDYEAPADHNTNNEYLIKVVARDGELRGEHDFTVTVTNANDAPAFPSSSTSRSVDEGDLAGREVGPPVTATDEDRNPSDTLTYSLGGTDSSSFVIDSTTGQIKTKVALDVDEGRSKYEVTVEVSDGRDVGGAPDTATDDTIAVTINVQGVNDPPVLTGTTSTEYVENGTGNVAGYSATDPEDQSIRWGVSGINEDAFAISPDGILSFKSAPDYEDIPIYFVNVDASDGTSTSTLDVTVNIIDIDEPPDVTGSTIVEFAENEIDEVATYEHNDPENGSIEWSLAGTDADDLNIVGGFLGFNDPPDHEEKETYRVTVQAFDGNSTGTLAVVVTVTDVNEKAAFPSTETGQRSVLENTPEKQPVGTPVRAVDPDVGDSLTYILSGPDADHFDIEESTGQIRTGSALNREDRATFYVDVEVHDGKDEDGSPSTTTDVTIPVTITVKDVNEPPVVSGTSTTTFAENDSGTVATYTADDPENDSIDWSPGGTDGSAFTMSEGDLSFVTPPNYEAKDEYRVTVQAFDGTSTTTYPVTITITDQNEPPDISGRTAITHIETASGPVETFKHNDPESNGITWELSGTDADDFTLTDGVLRFASQPDVENPADNDTNNLYVITIKATDDESLSDTIIVQVTVAGQNEPPTFPGATTSRDIPENTPEGQSIGSPVRASDPERDDLTYSLGGSDAGHFDISTSTGQILTKSALDYEGSRKSYTVTVSVHDGRNPEGNDDTSDDATITVTVNVTNEDEAPEITSGATTTSWKENVTGTVATYTANDPENATTTWSLHGNDAADFGITEAGELYIDTVPDYENKRNYQVRVQVSDGSNIADLDVTVNITNVDEPGVVTLSPSSPQVDTPINAGVTDPDLIDSDITWSWQRSKSNTGDWASISDATGSAYTPGNADEGMYLRATASYDDGHGTGKTASGVTDSTVPTTNRQPSFIPGTTRNVLENTPPGEKIGDPVTAQNDEADDTLVYELRGDDADVFGFSTSTGQIYTKELLDFEDEKNSYSVVVYVSDGKDVNNNPDPSNDDQIEVVINVRNVNEPPKIIGETAFTVDENTTGTVATFTATDPDANSTENWSVGGDDGSAFDIAGGVLTFRSPPDYEVKSTYMLTVEVSDGTNSDTLDVTVNIRNLDEDGSVSFSSDQPQRGTPLTATVSDPDKDISDLTWTWVIGTTTVRTATSSTGTTDSYTPVEADVGRSIEVTVSYTDGQGSGKSASATSANSVRVPPVVNHAPTYSSNTAERSVPENTGADENIGSPVEASDQNVGDNLKYTLGGQDAASFDMDSSNGQLKTKAELDHETEDTYTVTVTATDPSNEEATVTVTITVADVDEPPDFTSGPTSVNYAETAMGPVATYTAVDPEGEQVVWEKTGVDGSHFSVNNGVLTFNAQPDYDNPRDDDRDNEYHVVVVAQVQGSNATATRPVTVTVTPRNEPPQFPNGDTGIRSVTENTLAGQNVGAPVSASDPESSDVLEYALRGRDARSFDIDSSTGQILTRAALNYESRRSYSVRVSVRDNKNADGNADTTIDDYIDITINVIDENEAPEITGATSANFAENSTRAVANYRGSDPEGGTVSWTVLGTDSAHFAITNSGVLSFDPAPDHENARDSDRNNVYHVTIQASDGNNINRLDVTVRVTNVEEAGTVELSSVQPQVDTPLTATLDDPDEVVSAITWRWESSTGRSRGWRTISNETSDHYTPAIGDIGRYLRVTASYTDGFNTRTKTARVVSENPVRAVPRDNSPPRFQSRFTSRSVNENTPPGQNIGDPVAATDDPGEILTYGLSGTGARMFSIGRSTGQIMTRMPLDHEANSSYSVMVTAADPSNATTSIAVTITVTDVDEAPVAVDDIATATEDGQAVTIDVLANDSDPEGSQLSLTAVTQPANGSAVMVGTNVEYTPAAGYYGSDSFTYTVSDGNLFSIGNVNVRVAADSDETIQLSEIPIQFVPIGNGGERILLSDHFSDPDEGHPPYQATSSDVAIMTVEVSDGYLSITPAGIGVATTTLTVSDTPGIRQEFRVVVYRPVVRRTDTETMHIVDPSVDTTLTSTDGTLSVLFQAGARDQFFQVAIDAQSNSCGLEAPIGHQHVCVLVDLFDLGAESIDENLDLPSTIHVNLNQALYSSVQAAITNGTFTLWKGHGPTDVSWEQIPTCPEQVGTDECYELTADENGSGGELTVHNIAGFSEFAAGTHQPAPPPVEPPQPTPPTTGGGGGTGGGSGGRPAGRSVFRGNQTPQIFGRTNVTFSENGTEPVAEFEAVDPDDDEITWSLLGYDRSKFEISQEGVLSFRNPPDYEDPQGRQGNTYQVILQAEDDGRPSEYDVHNVRVTVMQVNELGELGGEPELTVPENSIDPIAQYRVDDPERGTITWALSGTDADAFRVDENGRLSPVAALDFETPGGSDVTNVLTLTITATDDGEPELSADMDVSVTITNVNEAPLVDGIPGVDLGSDELPWLVDLGMYFTDPDGDALEFDFSGENITEVALAHLEDSTLSIDPVTGGEVTFHIVATDPGGLRAVTGVAVSVTEPEPEPTPAPAVTVPVPVSTPVPVPAVVLSPTPTAPETVVVAPGPEPTFAPLPPLVERRIRNQTQEPDPVSKVIVEFSLEPIDEPMADVSLPPVEEPEPPQAVSPIDGAAAGHGPVQPSASVEQDGGAQLWLILLLILMAIVTAVYATRMYVIHRL